MKCYPWSVNNFLLFGDAAHVSNPFLGHGFNGAMEECVLITDLIDKH